MKRVNYLLLFVISILSSCATISPPRTAYRSENRGWNLKYIEYVNISTEPVESKVYVNDTYVGISPLKVPLPSVPLRISQSGSYQVAWRDGDFGLTSHEKRRAKRSSTTTWSEGMSGSIQSYSFEIQALKDGYQPAHKLVDLSISSPSITKAINSLEPSTDGELQSTVYGYRDVLVVLPYSSENNRGSNAPMPLQQPAVVHGIPPQQQLGGKLSAPGVGSRWAVVIGVANYADTRIPSLRYASKDAKAFHDWAVSPTGGKYAPARVRLLLDEQSTGANIKDALFNWLGQALEEDVVTIYFAGHGSPQSPDHPDNLFLLPYDCRYDNISTTGFPMWDIETALKRYIKAKRVIVIADACHSGGVGQSFDIARRASRGLKVNPIGVAIHSLSKVGEGVCVISASDENQYSQESKDWGGGHGVFTYFLLKGLKGEADYNKDTSVTLGELTSFVSQEVRRSTKNAQSPTVAGRYDPALSIGR
jgi:hypothetical protein